MREGYESIRGGDEREPRGRNNPMSDEPLEPRERLEKCWRFVH